VTKSRRNWAVGAALLAAVVVTLLPLVWVLSTSMKLPRDFYTAPPVWIPEPITTGHYTALFRDFGAAEYFRNTLVIALGNTIFMLLLGIPAAYGAARHGAGGSALPLWMLVQRMLPPVTVLIPLFLVFQRLRLVDSYGGLILAYGTFNLPVAVWMLLNFFRDFPGDLQDAAMVDGCTELGAVRRIMLPLLAPAIVVVSLFLFTFAWNELLFPLILAGTSTKPIMLLFVSLLQSPTGVLFGEAAAAVMISIIPAYFLALFFQRYMVHGLTLGALK
jgi:multiple sugar transport system permease protein